MMNGLLRRLSMARLQVDTRTALRILKEYGNLEKHLKMKFSGWFNKLPSDLHVGKSQCFSSWSRTDSLCYSAVPSSPTGYFHAPRSLTHRIPCLMGDCFPWQRHFPQREKRIWKHFVLHTAAKCSCPSADASSCGADDLTAAWPSCYARFKFQMCLLPLQRHLKWKVAWAR